MIGFRMADSANSLWKRFIDGDDEAFKMIYDIFANKLFGYGLFYTSDREMLKDCIQEVFVHVFRKRGELKPLDNVGLYLFVALKNRLINEGSKISFSHDVYQYEPFLTDDTTVHDRMVEQETEDSRKRKLSAVLQNLSLRQQEVIHYRFVEGLNYEEIACLMEMNYQSVHNLLHRSLKKIREVMEEKGILLYFLLFRHFKLLP